MKQTVLLLSTATRWLGTARMPRALARAGFEVALITPRNSLAEKSRYVSRIRFISSTANPMEWLSALIQYVDEFSPQLLVPCDEMVIRLLFALILDPPRNFDPAQNARILDLITASLGDPRFYAVSVDKTMLPAAAEAHGVLVPRYSVAIGAHEAVAHASAIGYPVALKRRFGFAGQGVEIVTTREQLVSAAQRLFRPDRLDLGGSGRPQLLVQKFIVGNYQSQALVAVRGECLGSFAWERFAATTPVKGQTTLLRFVQSPQTREISHTLCRHFGITGFFNVQFVIDEQSGKPYLLEINRRIVTHTHLGERVGKDLAKALYAALGGKSVTDDELENKHAGETIVIFPREWLRDPQSANLAEFPVDVPWDEPELIEAMLAMRRED